MPRKQTTCHLVRYTPQSTEVDECVQAATRKHKGKKLGQGEQGATYVFERLVIKISTVRGKSHEASWLAEACTGQAMGELGIGPRIHRHFLCGGHGFIVMDRLSPVATHRVRSDRVAQQVLLTGRLHGTQMHKKGSVVRYVLPKDQPVQTLDDLSAMSRAHQQAYVQALEAMIDRGYIHMDNHVGNLGTIAGRPVLFDFGFTQKRAGMDRRWALCFSVFQILEHCPPQILKGTLFYRVVADCLYGRGPRGPAGDPLVKFNDMEYLQRLARDASKRNMAHPDLYVGSWAYARLIDRELEDRPGPLLDFIYLVRNPALTSEVSKAVVALARNVTSQKKKKKKEEEEEAI